MKRGLFYCLNILLPLLTGTLVYLYWRPDSYISQMILHLLPAYSSPVPGRPVGIYRFIRYYLCDILWAHALVFALAFYFGRQKLMAAYMTGMCFVICAETIQLLPQTPGSFDVLDIILELLVCSVSIHIINYFEWRKVL